MNIGKGNCFNVFCLTRVDSKCENIKRESRKVSCDQQNNSTYLLEELFTSNISINVCVNKASLTETDLSKRRFKTT